MSRDRAEERSVTGTDRAKNRGKDIGSFGVRLFVIVSTLCVAALIAAAAIAYDIIRIGDDQAFALQRQLLQSEIAKVTSAGGADASAADGVAKAAPLPGLSFDTATVGEGRAQQALVDHKGRIAGFFNWDPPSSHRLFDPVALIAAGAFSVLLLFAAAVVWELRSARRKLVIATGEAERAAEVDKLTGLPNHTKMLALIDGALRERAADEAIVFAVIDLDGLAEAQTGALSTDELIVMIAQRLHDSLPENAICGRLGTAQFGVLFAAGIDSEAELMLRGVLDALAQPYWMDKLVRLTAQAGFAQVPLHAGSRSELSRRAEVALRSAASKGPGSLVMFDASLDQVSSDQKFIQRELPRALAAHELEISFQPIVSAAAGAIVGFEALLRWQHPTRGQISPGIFVPVAEQMGLIDQLGGYVLRKALHEAKRWPEHYVAVNLSPMQVRHPGIVETVRAALSEAGVSPARLTLEITEGVLIDNPEEMLRRIGDLHALGVRIALDDFGAGYSNLGYLQRFPFDKLKIDKSFVDALGTTANGGVILQAIVGLARALGLLVTAEGVETEQQRALLRLAGCDELQGYLFGKPMLARDIERIIRQPKAKPGAALTA
jgi:predicted signal transduction protein with EAL and GGDEF domain